MNHSFRNKQESLKSWYKQINKSFPCNCTMTETEFLPQHTPQGCYHWDSNMENWCLCPVPVQVSHLKTSILALLKLMDETHILDQLHRANIQ